MRILTYSIISSLLFFNIGFLAQAESPEQATNTASTTKAIRKTKSPDMRTEIETKKLTLKKTIQDKEREAVRLLAERALKNIRNVTDSFKKILERLESCLKKISNQNEETIKIKSDLEIAKNKLREVDRQILSLTPVESATTTTPIKKGSKGLVSGEKTKEITVMLSSIKQILERAVIDIKKASSSPESVQSE